MNTYIQNFGVTKSYINKNNNQTSTEVKWKGNYDGETANIDLQLIEDGNKQNLKLKLDNDELMELLNIHPVNKPLEQRLINDFMPDELYLVHKRPRKSRKSKPKKVVRRTYYTRSKARERSKSKKNKSKK